MRRRHLYNDGAEANQPNELAIAPEDPVTGNRRNQALAKDDARAALTRRELLLGAGGLLAAGALPAIAGTAAAASRAPQQKPAAADLTGQLARYMVGARGRELPAKLLQDTKHHILDTIAAMISGSRLKPGEMAIRYIKAQGGTAEASVLTTSLKTTAVNAALANGMFAHADETDDFEPVTKAHPGCGIVAASLAMAEREGRSGAELIRAVALGYDLCCRFLMALGPDSVRATHRSAEAVGASMGTVGAAASLARLDETGMRYALSYAAQQTSGLWSWVADSEHIEKAFDFGGMGARNGVTAVTMVQLGFTGVRDVFSGEHNVLEAFSAQPHPQEMIAGLGERFFVSETAIKTYSVGYPIQAALDAFFTLRKENNLRADNVEKIVVRLPEDGAGIVDNSAMPDVNLQYALAVALVDGKVSFAAANDRARMTDPQIMAVRQRVELIADQKLMDPAAPRSGQVDVTLRDGRAVSHFTKFPSGTKENPLDAEGVNAKARDLMTPVVGAPRSAKIIERINTLEKTASARELIRSLLTV